MYCQIVINTIQNKGIGSERRGEMPHLIKRLGMVSLRSKWNKGIRHVWWKSILQRERTASAKGTGAVRKQYDQMPRFTIQTSFIKTHCLWGIRRSKGCSCHVQCVGVRVTEKAQRLSCCPGWNRICALHIYNIDSESLHIIIETALICGSGDLELIFKYSGWNVSGPDLCHHSNRSLLNLQISWNLIFVVHTIDSLK